VSGDNDCADYGAEMIENLVRDKDEGVEMCELSMFLKPEGILCCESMVL
jgi:hypothetical protein